jgi:hypothetical protein
MKQENYNVVRASVGRDFGQEGEATTLDQAPFNAALY